MECVTNTAKTFVLLAALGGLLVGLGSLFGRGFMFVGLILAIGMNAAAYFFSKTMALKMSRARPVSEAEAPELHAMITRLAKTASLPKPSVHLIPSEQANAFATGRNPANAAVAVTEGLMRQLTPGELEGVLAHEMAHIQNRDILISSVAATVAAGISFIATMARFGAIFGGSDDDDGPGMAGVLVASIVAPLAAMVIQLAVSRSREFQADKEGAKFCGQPLQLASALRRIEASAHASPMNVNPSSASAYIINPFGGMGGRVAKMFMTHPPTAERIRRLEELAKTS